MSNFEEKLRNMSDDEVNNILNLASVNKWKGGDEGLNEFLGAMRERQRRDRKLASV